MITINPKAVLAVPLALLLYGCSSGGSSSVAYLGSLGTATTLRPLPANAALNGSATGVGLAFSGSTTDVSGNVIYPTTTAYGPASTAIAVLTDSTGDLDKAAIRLPDLSTGTAHQYNSPTTTQSYFDGSGVSTTPPTVYVYSESAPGTGQIKAVEDASFSYQFYGEWNVVQSSTSGFDGFFSSGIASKSLPTSGSASYSGQTIGKYVDASGNVYATAANMTSTATFGSTPSISFNTTGTVVQQVNTTTPPAAAANSNLDLSGTLTISGVGFSGTVTSSTTSPSPLGLSGTASGNFYGPGISAATGSSVAGSPSEIGGTYQLSGTGGKLIGAFGGVVQ